MAVTTLTGLDVIAKQEARIKKLTTDNEALRQKVRVMVQSGQPGEVLMASAASGDPEAQGIMAVWEDAAREASDE